MKLEVYNEIVKIIRLYDGSNICPNRKCHADLQEKFPEFSDYTLGSIYSIDYQRKMKRNHQKHQRAAEDLYRRYTEAVRNAARPGVLLEMSDQLDLSPALLARIILEHDYERHAENSDITATKSTVTKMMKDTTLIKDMRLAYEVFLCILHDDQYGPISDSLKHSLGQEYEMKLQQKVKELNLPFCHEEHLRKYGYDKTPDVKLEVPIAVDGFIIHWIESKALFGDEEGHRSYLRDQYISYYNRFGPGLVIYWFGFIDTLAQISDRRFIIRDDFPTNIAFINPKCWKPRLFAICQM